MWFTDKHGNRASTEYWGSEEAARTSLTSLKNCSNCSNCSDCSNCSNCSRCFYCSDCYRCSNCSNCSNCSRCFDCSDCYRCFDCSNCSRCSDCSRCSYCDKTCVVGPTRSDGYTFFVTQEGRVKAGCRDFTFAEAYAHWERTRRGTRLGRETIAILDYLRAEYTHK